MRPARAKYCQPSMHFLIVDESSESRDALAAMLRARWPQATVDGWDPQRQGSPRAAIGQGLYSAVLLDTHPAGADGIQWVGEIRQERRAPPVILVSDAGGE